MSNTHEYINIHHSVTPQGEPTVRAVGRINYAHQNRWPGLNPSSLGYYVGYHYLINSNGDVVQTRADNDTGVHNNINNMNYKAIGVCLIGNFEDDKLEGEQRKSLIQLVASLTKKYKIPKENIGYHKQFKATQCPGKNVIDQWNDILDEIYEVGIPEWAIAEGVYDFVDELSLQTGDPTPFKQMTQVEFFTFLKRYHESVTSYRES